MTVAVIGLGFVGLTTALGLAHYGHTVYGVERDKGRRAMLENGVLPFQEPGMGEELREQLNRNLFLDIKPEEAVTRSEFIFYCVGTPCGERGEADLTALLQAVGETVASVKDDLPRVLTIKSTVPPSTTAQVVAPYLAEKMNCHQKFHLANNPEFLREGHCWEDFLHSDRIVIGSDDDYAKERLTDLYRSMELPICCVSASSGEFIKYLSNSFLAAMISFSNEMAEIAGHIGGIDIAQSFRILHMDKRWRGSSITDYIYPGCGYGGYCLPKDTKALSARARKAGAVTELLDAVIHTNENQPAKIAVKIAGLCEAGSTIGILGLSFKPGSDDVRDSPAYKVVQALRVLGKWEIAAYDPVAIPAFQAAYPETNLKLCNSLEELCRCADVLAIVTAWPEFRTLKNIKDKHLIDCRYML